MAMTLTEPELLRHLADRMDQMVALLAAKKISGDENEKIERLYSIGMEPAVIGFALGMTTNAVATRMSRIRSKNK